MDNSVLPQVFYKYVSAATAKIILKNSTLRWSSPLLFNDLLEFQRMPVFKPSLAEATNQFPEKIYEIASKNSLDLISLMKQPQQLLINFVQKSIANDVPKSEIIRCLRPSEIDYDANFESYMREQLMRWNLKYARVLCLTTDYKNNAMWANYADNHGGCVLGFRHIPELDTPLQEAKPVIYSDEPFVVGSGLDFMLYNDTPDFLSNLVSGICRSKEKSWAYENEWRVFTWRKKEADSDFKDYSFL